MVLTQTPAAKPARRRRRRCGPRQAAPTMRAQGEWLHLTVNPRVEDGALQLTADKVDVSRASGDAFAHGNVKASWMDAGAQATASRTARQRRPGQRGSGRAGSGACDRRRSAVAPCSGGTTGEATFRGHARLWQQANSVAAPVIVLDRERQTLVARTTDAAEPVRAVLVSAGGAEPGKEHGKARLSLR